MRAGLGLLLLSLVLSGCGPALGQVATPTPAPVANVKIGYPSLGGNLMAVWTAQDAGLFARYGLTSEADYIAGSPNTIKALLAGDNYYVGSVFPRAPYVSEAGIQTLPDLVAQEDPKAAEHRAAEYIDSRFVKALEDDGFLRQLYPG